jgi:hypothetical protein
MALPDARQAEERLRRERPLLGDTPEEIRQVLPLAQRGAAEEAASWRDIDAYVMFIGYPRSGHSIVGSLLDAHPQVIIAHELNALKFVEAGCTREELYWLLLHNSRQFAEHGRQWGDYRYEVPGQWQGRFSALRVIGDKKGGSSSMLLAREPGLLERLRKLLPERMRIIHVTRNPFDNIATLARKDTRDLGAAIELYFRLCKVNAGVSAALGAGSVLHVRHEDLIADAARELRRLCAFLGVEPAGDYLAACARIVSPAPHRSRDGIEWPAAARAKVEAGIAQFDFLGGYSFT